MLIQGLMSRRYFFHAMPIIAIRVKERRGQQVIEAMKREAIGIEKGRLNVRRGQDGKGLELTRQEAPGKGSRAAHG